MLVIDKIVIVIYASTTMLQYIFGVITLIAPSYVERKKITCMFVLYSKPQGHDGLLMEMVELMEKASASEKVE